MEKIASFTINHDTLEKGMYISRIDGDIVTYDIRMKLPNNNDFLANGAMHSFEHLFAKVNIFIPQPPSQWKRTRFQSHPSRLFYSILQLFPPQEDVRFS